ncbi:MAG: DUF29 domain-containing protein [Geitlerinemataceae cyanobacterium]
MTLAQERLALLYERDRARWLEATLQRLRDRDYDNIDWDNLLEELDDMARSDRRAIKNNTVVILVHLLKWQYQPEMRTGSWAGSITEHRTRILALLDDSPSLRNALPDAVEWAYPRAKRQASDETGLRPDRFPETCSYKPEDVYDDDFWPDAV